MNACSRNSERKPGSVLVLRAGMAVAPCGAWSALLMTMEDGLRDRARQDGECKGVMRAPSLPASLGMFVCASCVHSLMSAMSMTTNKNRGPQAPRGSDCKRPQASSAVHGGLAHGETGAAWTRGPAPQSSSGRRPRTAADMVAERGAARTSGPRGAALLLET